MDEHLAILGHDLRSELSSIIGLTELIETVSNHPEVREFTQLIRNHNHFMLDLVNGLVVRAKSGGIEPTLAPMSAWNLIMDVARGLAIGLDRPPIAVATVGHIPELIVSDAILLRQILTNLVGNAVRFTREGGVRIHLEYMSEARQIRFSIADTGPGMTPEQLARLFQPDCKVHREGTSPGGHGLGLWIPRYLVDRLAGEISVRSLSGHGTLIEVQIPADPSEGARMLTEAELRDGMPQHKTTGSTQDQGSFAGLRFLVADDVPANRLIAAALLKRRGASITLAVDGVEAVRLAKMAQDGHRPFDLMIFDYHMPHMDGMQAAAILRRDGCTAPILCWTSAARSTLGNFPEIFTALLEKPAAGAKFYAVLTECLAKSRQAKAKR